MSHSHSDANHYQKRNVYDTPIERMDQEYSFPYSWTGLKGSHMQRCLGTVIELGILETEDGEHIAYGQTRYDHRHVCDLVIELQQQRDGTWQATGYRDNNTYGRRMPQFSNSSTPERQPTELERLWLTIRAICEADYNGTTLSAEEIADIESGKGIVPKSKHWR